MAEQEVFVSKVVLSTGKVVLIREPKIKDQDLAMQAAVSRAPSGNQTAIAALMQKEFIKMLVVEINGTTPAPVQMENLDDLFTYREYLEMSNALSQIMGTDAPLGNLQIELVKRGK